MKFISCLKSHVYFDHVGIVIDATKGIKFYTVTDIIQNMPHLFKYKVLNISATNGKFDIAAHDVPVVVYYLEV